MLQIQHSTALKSDVKIVLACSVCAFSPADFVYNAIHYVFTLALHVILALRVKYGGATILDILSNYALLALPLSLDLLL